MRSSMLRTRLANSPNRHLTMPLLVRASPLLHLWLLTATQSSIL
jgi:hypothetical protein